jgi:CHAT domain-containing protein
VQSIEGAHLSLGMPVQRQPGGVAPDKPDVGGARSVVVTLWSVNDTATGHLMKAFYANLNRGMAKDAALRTAKLSLLTSPHASGRNPYFWAPFVLIGER